MVYGYKTHHAHFGLPYEMISYAKLRIESNCTGGDGCAAPVI